MDKIKPKTQSTKGAKVPEGKCSDKVYHKKGGLSMDNKKLLLKVIAKAFIAVLFAIALLKLILM